MGKKNEDCRFFCISTCAQGDNCTFRHSEIAKNTTEICSLWLRKMCSDIHCPKRHMRMKVNNKNNPGRNENQILQNENIKRSWLYSTDDCSDSFKLPYNLTKVGTTNVYPSIMESHHLMLDEKVKCLKVLYENESEPCGGARPKIPNYTQECARLNRSKAKENRKEREVVGWTCERCTFINIPTRPGCEMCTQERPEYYRIPVGYMPPPSEAQRIQNLKDTEKKIKQMEKQERENNYKEILDADEGGIVICKQAEECPICNSDTDITVTLRDCLHKFCSPCLSRLIETSETVEIQCPFWFEDFRCTSLLQDREIRAIVSPEVYSQHLLKSLSVAETQLPSSFHCRTPDCIGFCEIEENVHRFFCPVCSHENCINCSVIHEGLNCQEYQKKIDLEASTKEEARKTKESLQKMISQGLAMHCPKCNVIITKNGGCDGMKCIMCQTDICWATKGPRWGPAGFGDVSGGCRCKVGGVRCHPHCQNCH